ncbi:ribosomal-protein-alanine acetyltransferase [Lactobacillus nasalidis]|uniref:Ribosomal-protein-alanine acetyltransferase n=1 Tax=Lactobacillus nasalidis TaxID=2797258 RepID=A0ABQ3W9X2_9LACO|nr:ribosomal protein S18-alanine N-acetyltransferase [Lactobacillus nasalidis]GHV98202.1 ribosomal-protein-alanine acetyltransferase [Lactobacillus nasalidis]GHV98958.1 ribosomal-protein-alanine acetyltransferase [Lactobacillus nasalidis]GHW01884.1 ribosomal-protein-alanine acetyltransferase [Lactobacillus nasalidis]
MGLFFKADLVRFAPRAVSVNGQEYSLRKATADELAQLLLLEKEVYAGALPWNEQVFYEELLRRDSIYLLLRQGDYLVGAVGCRFGLHTGHVTFLAVVPDRQNQGLGTYLLKTVLDQAKAGDLRSVTLEVRAENVRAQALYRRLGFRDNFVRKNYYSNYGRRNSDGLNMICDLRKKN